MPLDPQLATLLDALARAGFSEVDRIPLDVLRHAAAEPRLPRASGERAERRTCHGPGGPIELQVFRAPNAPGLLGGVVCFAGAGFVIGEIDGHSALCAALAAAASCVVVSVACRLAPEQPFPAAVDDAYAALCHVHEHADGFGIDHTRLAVLGTSSGATLATTAARLAKERRNPPLVLQVLLTPITDLRSFDTASYREFAQTGPLRRASLEHFAAAYATPAQRADARCSPLAARNLIGLPRTLLITAECDPVRDEAEAYADALRAAHVPVLLNRCAGMVHGFVLLQGQLPAAARALEQCAAALREAFAPVAS